MSRERRHPKHFPDRVLSPSLQPTTSLAEAVEGADIVLVAVHSTRFRATARLLANVVSPEQVIVSTTKGIELETFAPMSEVLRAELPRNVVGALGGVNLTHDILNGQLSEIIIATNGTSDETARVATALRTKQLTVRTTEDLRGLEVVSILKNAAAITTAIAIGLGYSGNMAGIAISRSFREVETLGLRLGAKPSVFLDVCGLGDLFLTCVHAGSLNRRLGILLGQGRSLEEILAQLPEVPEGVNATRAAPALASTHGVDVPVLRTTRDILEGRARPSALEDALRV